VISDPRYGESMQLWIASIMVMVLATLGTRVAFALPLDLRANWIFRVIGVRAGLETLAANRRALLLLSVIPVWVVTAIVCLWLWPGRENAGHLVVLGLLGMILADICLLRFPKIPFTCSWLPGKSHFNMAFLGALGLLMVGSKAVAIERSALSESGRMAVMLSLLAVAWVCVRWTTVSLTKREEQELRFEDEAPPQVMTLGLYRDGVMSIEIPETTRTS
jgi:hypothetical protein